MKKIYYFAYGSNMDIFRMFNRCEDTEIVGVGYIKDYKLSFRKNSSKTGVANIEECKGNKLMGVIYKVSIKGMLSLDGFEGHPRVYKRTDIVMYDEKTNEKYNGMTYIKNGGEIKLPSDKYLGHLLDGCRQFGIDTWYIEDVVDEIDIIEKKKKEEDDKELNNKGSKKGSRNPEYNVDYEEEEVFDEGEYLDDYEARLDYGQFGVYSHKEREDMLKKLRRKEKC